MRFNTTLTLAAGLMMTLAACGSDTSPGDKDNTGDSKTNAVSIKSFTVNPGEIQTGAKAQLVWEVTGPDGTTITISDGSKKLLDASSALAGNKSTGAVTADTTYTLTAKYGSTSVEKTASLKVTAGVELAVSSFSADPSTVSMGRSSELSWKVSGPAGTTVTVVDGAGKKLVDAGTNLTGAVSTGAVLASTTYTLTAKAGSQTIEKTATVTVTAADKPVVKSFTGSQGVAVRVVDHKPDVDPIALRWEVEGASSIRITDEAGNLVHEATEGTGEFSWVLPEDTYHQTLTLTADNHGAISTATAEVGTAGFIFSAIADPIFITGNEEVTLSWEAAGEVQVRTGAGTLVPVPAGQSSVKVTLAAAAEYTLVATQFGVASAPETVSVALGVDAADATAADRNIKGIIPAASGGRPGLVVLPLSATGGEVFRVLSTNSSGTQCTGPARIFDADDTMVGKAYSDSIPCIWDLADAPRGDYQIALFNTTAQPVEYYLHIVALAPACGDGNLTRNSGEQCDDKNLTPGDGCTQDCQLEVVGAPMATGDTREVSTTTAEHLLLTPYTSAADAVVNISTAVAAGGACPTMNLGLGDPDARWASVASGACPNMRALVGAGDYLIGMVGAQTSGLQLTVADLNTPIPSKTDDGAWTGAGTSVPAEGPVLSTHNSMPGVAKFTLTSTMSVSVTSAGACNADTTNALVLAPRSSYLDLTTFGAHPLDIATAAIGSDPGDCPAMGAASTMALAALPPGEYLVGYLNYQGTAGQPGAPNVKSANVNIELTPVSCGNGIVEPGEACDAGAASIPACTGCAWTGTSETEPNNTTPQAITLPAMVRANLTRGDQDVYSFQLTDAATVSIKAAGLTPDQCMGLIAVVVKDAAGQTVLQNRTSCEQLEGALPVGAYTITVLHPRQYAVPYYYLDVHTN